MDILNKLQDLRKQATTENSHFYVASCVEEAMKEIIALRIAVDVLIKKQPKEGDDE